MKHKIPNFYKEFPYFFSFYGPPSINQYYYQTRDPLSIVPFSRKTSNCALIIHDEHVLKVHNKLGGNWKVDAGLLTRKDKMA